ncbi:MAG: PAS domain S-box protein [Syntrophorhabdaceae bacterium]|nr:PAS domain S-box protein [Syntrophorhabdaceae bacterium]
MKRWVFLTSVLIFMAACFYLFYSTYQRVKNDEIEQLNKQQMAHAKQARAGMEGFFQHYLKILNHLARHHEIINFNEDGKRAIAEFYEASREDIRSITRVDAAGRFVYTIPDGDRYRGADISHRDFFQAMKGDLKPVVSDVITSVKGQERSMALHHPIVKNGRFVGSVAIIVSIDDLADKYLKPIRIARTGYAWVLNRKGVEMYCPVPGHIGVSIYETSGRFPSVIAMAEEMMKGKAGVTTYDYDYIADKETKKIVKHAVYMPIVIGDTFWSIVVATPENEALAAMEGFRNRLFAIIGLFVVGLFVFVFYTVKSWAVLKEAHKRMEAEEASLQSEARYRSIIENAVEGIYQSTADGRFMSVNPAFSRITGYGSPEHLTQEITDIGKQLYVDPEDRRIFERTLEKEGVVANQEVRFRRRDGKIIWVSLNGRAVKDKDGKVLHYEGTIEDVTDRRKAEEALRAETEKLQTLSENAPVGMVLISPEGRFTYVNTKFREMFGYDLGHVPDGRTWFRKAYPDKQYRTAVISAWINDFVGNEPGERKPRVFTVTCSSGKQRLITFVTMRLTSGEHLMVCEDMTELKRLEDRLRQSQKMEAIGNLAGGVAHDFNNILTTIMGYASLLQQETGDNSRARSHVEQILSASQRAANLTQSLLAFSRHRTVSLKPLNLNESLKSAEKLLKRLLTEDIEFRLILTDGDTTILADATEIDQILFNLVSNARDAMTRGGRLTIETGIVEMDSYYLKAHGFGQPGKYVSIAVSDTGTGMDEATRERMFDPFFTTKEIGKGTGLGLATVYGIVSQHNGYINVYSEPGKGATFRIFFPLAAPAAKEEEPPAVDVNGGDETILIAEDNESVMTLIKEVLRKYGYRTLEASDGEEAVEIFRDNKGIDLVILDSVMPRKNGREACEDIRKIDPGMKVLFISGHTRDTRLDRGIADEEVDFLPKPLSPIKLLQTIREILDRA